jgi:hypothetical protein
MITWVSYLFLKDFIVLYYTIKLLSIIITLYLLISIQLVVMKESGCGRIVSQRKT